jgi:hypothetical protein
MSNPFGLTKGMQIEDIDRNAELAAYGVYVTRSVPKPHSAFERYALRVAPVGGLYAVKALGNDVSTDPGGFALRAEFNRMKQKLESSYGKHAFHDFLAHGSKWNESLDWMMGLASKERTLAAFWDREEKSSLPDDIAVIFLSAVASGSDSGFITLEYNFDNSKACEQELAAAEDDAL